VFVIMIDLHDHELLTIFLVGLAVILATSEIGHWLGMRAAGRGGDDVSTLENAAFGMLALIIAFTFAMAVSRFEARRDALVSEANAIGTTALRARLLPEPHRAESLKVLREYVKIRLDITEHLASRTEPAAIDRSNVLEEALWQQAKAIAAKDNGFVPTGLFIQAVNDMIDSGGKRLAALRNRVPNIVLLSLFGLAAIAGGFTGYASGLDARRTRTPVYIIGLVVSVVILLILDLDRPSRGFIQVSQQPMIDAAASIAAFSD
jgi:uncharacterized membrane protein YidH (DUF202 family)